MDKKQPTISSSLKKYVKEAVMELYGEEADFVIEHPDEIDHGDYSTNIALILAKKLKAKPREIAEKISEKLKEKKILEIERINVAGAGFINFYLSKEFFCEAVAAILWSDKDYGKNDVGKGKKVIIEYSSPNIAKPFTIGHLRSTIIGSSIANILSASGYEVVRDNHLGDWGTQFGKMISAIKRWGNEEDIEKSEDKMKKLVSLYVKFHEEVEKDPKLEDEGRKWFASLEKGDTEARRLWKKCIEWSLTEFNKIYERLDVKFDTALGESFFEDKMKDVLRELEEKGLVKKSEGARLVFFPNEKYPPLMIEKSDGSTLYSTRDLATDKYRLKTYGNDITIINEVGIEQSLYFEQLFETENILGWFNDGQRIHLGHGLYSFKDGKMSTRKGNVIWLEDLLNEAVDRARKINEETAEMVGVGAIKFNDLKREAKQNIIFDWEEVVTLKGDSGPYLQYSHARAISILEKAKTEKISEEKMEPSETWSITELEKMLYRFPEIVERAGREYAPNHIARFLLEISAVFNAYYAKNKIVDANDINSPYKVLLTRAFSIVLRNGLNLLGIEAPKKM